MTKASSKAIVGLILPNIEEASIMAVTISEKNNLSENEQAFFIAGFQECIK